MGAACEQCMQMFNKPPQEEGRHPKGSDGRETNRPMTLNTFNVKQDKNESVCNKGGGNSEIESNSSVSVSVRDIKIFKTKSTALFSTDSQRRHSSILQFTLDHESVIIRGINETQNANPSPDKYYTLIDKVAFVKKTMDCIKVTSPDGQSELHCQPQYLFSTLTVSEGRPVEAMQEVAPNKVIQISDSPIKLKATLKCRSCKKQIKISACKGVLNVSAIQCSGCDVKGTWSIIDIVANATIWGDGQKIDNHEQVQDAPGILRIMGCVVCFKYSNLSKMKCGCLLCAACQNENKQLTLQMQCRMCEGSYIL